MRSARDAASRGGIPAGCRRRQPAREWLALLVGADEHEHAVEDARVEHGDDRVVVERGGQPRLAGEAVPERDGLDPVRPRDLQRHRATEVGVGRPIDHAEPAPAEFALDPEPSERLPDRQLASGRGPPCGRIRAGTASGTARGRLARSGDEGRFEQPVHRVVGLVPNGPGFRRGVRVRGGLGIGSWITGHEWLPRTAREAVGRPVGATPEPPPRSGRAQRRSRRRPPSPGRAARPRDAPPRAASRPAPGAAPRTSSRTSRLSAGEEPGLARSPTETLRLVTGQLVAVVADVAHQAELHRPQQPREDLSGRPSRELREPPYGDQERLLEQVGGAQHMAQPRPDQAASPARRTGSKRASSVRLTWPGVIDHVPLRGEDRGERNRSERSRSLRFR